MKATNLIAFAIGAAVGSVTTWYLVKKKYEQIAQEEIDSVKEVFGSKIKYDGPQDSDEAKAAFNREKPSVAEYAKLLSKEGYTNYSNSETSTTADTESDKEEEKVEAPSLTSPYVISPDQFREFEDYDVISLRYYADHILADEDDRIVEDVEGIVGFESLNHFGEYEEDSVFVRNDRLKVDVEILLDQRDYNDVLKTKPYLKED